MLLQLNVANKYLQYVQMDPDTLTPENTTSIHQMVLHFGVVDGAPSWCLH